MNDRVNDPYVASSAPAVPVGMSAKGEQRMIELMEEQNKLLRKQIKILERGFEK